MTVILLGYLKHVHSICFAVSQRSVYGDLFLGKSLLVHYFAVENLNYISRFGGTSSDLGGTAPKCPSWRRACLVLFYVFKAYIEN